MTTVLDTTEGPEVGVAVGERVGVHVGAGVAVGAAVGIAVGVAVDGNLVAVAGFSVAVGRRTVAGTLLAAEASVWAGCAVSVACTALLMTSTSDVGLEQPTKPTKMTNTVTR